MTLIGYFIQYIKEQWDDGPIMIQINTLNSAYNEVAFNKKLAITKENLHTKYTPFTYNDITLNEKPHITKQILCISFSL